jgi:hypothetical protein
MGNPEMLPLPPDEPPEQRSVKHNTFEVILPETTSGQLTKNSPFDHILQAKEIGQNLWATHASRALALACHISVQLSLAAFAGVITGGTLVHLAHRKFMPPINPAPVRAPLSTKPIGPVPLAPVKTPNPKQSTGTHKSPIAANHKHRIHKTSKKSSSSTLSQKTKYQSKHKPWLAR